MVVWVQLKKQNKLIGKINDPNKYFEKVIFFQIKNAMN